MLQPLFDIMRFGWLPVPAELRSGPRRFAVISVSDLVEVIVDQVTSGTRSGQRIEPSSIASISWADVAGAAGVVRSKPLRLLRFWPGLLVGLGWASSAVATMTRRALPLSSGKARELLVSDWTYDTAVQGAMTLEETIAACLPDRS